MDKIRNVLFMWGTIGKSSYNISVMFLCCNTGTTSITIYYNICITSTTTLYIPDMKY